MHDAIKRLVCRPAHARDADRFDLMGALSSMTWFDEPFRRTRDLDLLDDGESGPGSCPGILQRDAVRRSLAAFITAKIEAALTRWWRRAKLPVKC